MIVMSDGICGYMNTNVEVVASYNMAPNRYYYSRTTRCCLLWLELLIAATLYFPIQLLPWRAHAATIGSNSLIIMWMSLHLSPHLMENHC